MAASGEDVGDQLELGLGGVGGDLRVRQRRAQTGRVRPRRKGAVGQHAQTLFLDAAAQAAEHVGCLLEGPEELRRDWIRTAGHGHALRSPWEKSGKIS